MKCKAKISSLYHGSAVDGEGLRSVVFFSGCNLRCPFCHNPETFTESGEEVELSALVKKIARYKNYIKKGGVTLSGGEPFLQAEFCQALVDELHTLSIKVIAETNGTILDKDLIAKLDGVRLDIKNFNGESAEELSQKYDTFIDFCDKFGTEVHLTNVLIPTINDSEKSANELKKWLSGRKIELLPFKKMCIEKYDRLGLPFPYIGVREGNKEDAHRFYSLLEK